LHGADAPSSNIVIASYTNRPNHWPIDGIDPVMPATGSSPVAGSGLGIHDFYLLRTA
jgi:hypothetical protein